MVFFRKRMTRTVLVHPQYLGRDLHKHIGAQVVAEVQGESVKDIGFVIQVLAIEEAAIGKGLIDHMTGRVRYEVAFDAIVFRPFKNEVMDTVCTVCTSQGIFADAGPFSLFVSRVYIPAEMEFRAEDSSWVSTEGSGGGSGGGGGGDGADGGAGGGGGGGGGLVIRQNSNLRLKVVGSKTVSRGYSGIGTINEPFLGAFA